MKSQYKMIILYSTFCILLLVYIICIKEKNIFREAFTSSVLKINTLSRMNPTYRPMLQQPYNDHGSSKPKMLASKGDVNSMYSLYSMSSINEEKDENLNCKKGQLYNGKSAIRTGENECNTNKYCIGCKNATFYKNTRRNTGFCKCM